MQFPHFILKVQHDLAQLEHRRPRQLQNVELKLAVRVPQINRVHEIFRCFDSEIRHLSVRTIAK
jgi:hypothetical protein